MLRPKLRRKQQETNTLRKLAAALILLAATNLSGAATPKPMIVRTVDGLVSGIPAPGKVTAYKGIRYAAPPIGARRWQAPQPTGPWSGVYAADKFGPACIQPPSERETSEDCLFLNVWVPEHARGQKLPVMVWAYGGGFVNGAASDPRFDGAALARRGVVLVSLNYRLGTLGFFAHPALSGESHEHTSGNYALLDLFAALQWVQENIGAFGGDARRVTAFGQSSGAMLLSNALITPRAKGLFQQVILESGGQFREYHRLAAAERLGAKAGDIAALRAMDPDRLPTLPSLEGSPFPRPLFAPKMSGPIVDGPVLADQQRDAFEAGNFLKMPTLLGNNSDEGSYVTRNYPVRTLDDYRAYLRAPAVFGADADEAMRLYPAASDAAVPAAVAQSFGDAQYNYGTRGVARAMASAGQPVYRYLFTRKAGGTGPGPNHGDEVSYVFNTLGSRPTAYNDDDRRLAETMADAWVRFAKTGNPNGGSLPAWPRYRASDDAYMQFGGTVQPGTGFRGEQLDFIGRVQAKAARSP
jgi:para-nitrobenzyl esterase